MKIINGDTIHLDSILEIFNDAIAHSTALYEYHPRTPEVIHSWFQAKRAAGLPVLIAVDDAERLMGFASYGPFRAFPAYKYTVEHSLYVARDQRGRGVGSMLLDALISKAAEQQLHVLVGAVDSDNVASIALHERFGFQLSGTVKHAGYKFGRWLDVSFYQLILPTPTHPNDG
jgi:phosphinothricin acetyltransferase